MSNKRHGVTQNWAVDSYAFYDITNSTQAHLFFVFHLETEV